MFVVMGATGHVGSAVANALLNKGAPITILTRYPERATTWQDKGATVVFADADDVGSLHSALRDAKRAFLLNPPADPKEDTDATERRTVANILSAMRNTELEKIVIASTYGSQPGEAIGDFATLWEFENGLPHLSVRAAINRGAYYMSNWLAFADQARQSGVLPSMFPADAEIPMVAPEDLGKVAADRMISSMEDTGLAYVEGPKRYSPREVAAAFSDALKQKIEVQVVSREDFVEVYEKAGFSSKAAHSYSRMTAMSIDHDFYKPSSPIRGNISLQSYISAAMDDSS